MTTKQKIAIVHRYFWPQNYPYATMLKDVAEELANNNADITIYTSFSNIENEMSSRALWMEKYTIKIKSTLLLGERQSSVMRKAFNAVWFAIWIFFKLLVGKYDVVMVATTPPVIIAFLVALVSRVKGYRVVYHCQDIHPEALNINGSLSSTVAMNVLMRMDSFTVKNAWRVIVLSEDMKQTLINRGLDNNNIRIINNFIFEKCPDIKNTGENEGQKKMRLIFAGSLGRFQNLEVLIEGIAKFIDRDDVEFLFLGDGPMKLKLEAYCQQHQLGNVLFVSQVDIATALNYMQKSDAGIVSVSRGITDVAYPSKSIMYMSTGLPVFAVLDPCSELARSIESNNLGVSVAPNVPDIEKGINLLIDKVGRGIFDYSKIRGYAEENFGKDVILKKMAQVVLEEVET